MLRLLPKRLYAGLFGQQAWLAEGAKGQPMPAPPSLPVDASLPDLLDAMLLAAPFSRRANKLSVMLPSHAVRCVSLPWSRHLRGADEKHAYALAHLEQAGLSGGDSHVVHAEFRHFGAHGFAYAVPLQTLDGLHTVAARHQLELTTALPIGGVAHLAARRARGTGIELSLIVEDSAISALAVNRTGLLRYDAEPAFGGQRAALKRLLTRIAANGVEVSRVSVCADREEAELANIVGAFTAQVPPQVMNSMQWRSYL